MSFAEVAPEKDPRSHMDVGPTKPWLPSKQEELAKKRNPRAPRSEEAAESAQDLYEKAKQQHEENMSAKEEEHMDYAGEEHSHEGGGAGIDLGGNKVEKDVTAYVRFYGGPHSMFQPRKEQAQFTHQDED